MVDVESLLLDRLESHPLADRPADLVLAATLGADELADALGGDRALRPSAGDGSGAPTSSEPAGAFLRSVTVRGFRGIGPAATIELEPGPGLTVVCGRNGSGKSSFAEALEVLFTGKVSRLEERSAVWKDSWRCHHGDEPIVSAELVVEGIRGPVTVTRSWDSADTAVTAGTSRVTVVGEGPSGLDRLGWGEALSLYRPFLSHAELEVLQARPAELYDQLNGLLGLDELAVIAQRLAEARKRADAIVSAAKTGLKALRAELDGIDDERAVTATSLLGARNLDLDALEQLASGQSDQGDGGMVSAMALLATLPVPTADDVDRVRRALTDAADQLESAGTAAATDASATADLLAAAIAHFDRHGPGPCPVCARPDALDSGWRAATSVVVGRLQETAAGHAAAHRVAEQAIDAARKLVVPPSAFQAPTITGIDLNPVRDSWAAWSAVPPLDPSPAALRTLAAHLRDLYPPLMKAAMQLAAEANAELARRRDLWAPSATSIAAWVVSQRAAERAAADASALRTAEAWVKAANHDLRNDRLRPYAEGTTALWAKLRQGSNVDLVAMSLSGSATRRAVDFDVTVDGSPAAGLGVMSQGEVNALALSVFLPRATSADSPLRFVVVDDPVQAMDPSKVDGLAQVFAEAAATRQVIVFTHDERLPAALRHLNLPARIVQVTRQVGSAVEISAAGNPATQYLKDAGALAAGDQIPPAVAGRVVPGLCRNAIEATCIDLVRRRRLTRGDSHDSIDEAIMAATRLLPRLALAAFDDADRGGDVYDWLNRQLGPGAASTVRACNYGTHHGAGFDAGVLVGDTRRLVARLGAKLR